MFLKAADKKDKNTGKIYRYYKLCESYRLGNSIRHHTLLTLGKLDEIDNETEKKLLADRIEQLLKGTTVLFSSDIAPHIEKLAQHYSTIIKSKGLQKHPVKDIESINDQKQDFDYQEVDLSTIELEDVREIGCEWLCKQALNELNIENQLIRYGWSQEQAQLAAIQIISRACFPASEHKTAQWINENSAVAELYLKNPASINRFHLYHSSEKLYQSKEVLEEYLSKKTNELFDLDDKIILADLTNTYFEGRKQGSKIARFYRSKEKRNDAKLVAIALVVNAEGFVKYSNIYRGNIADCKTLEQTVDHLSARTSNTGRKPVVVIDAGIANEDNLKMLRSKGYSYVCVRRSKLKEYETSGETVVQLRDRRDKPIEVRWVEKPGDEDQYLYVHSQMKAIKESSMQDHFCERYEQELEHIAASIHKKGTTKKYEKVLERIGRLKERYPSANKHYQITVEQKDGIAVKVNWKRKPLAVSAQAGTYFIRTNIQTRQEKTIWDIYNTIREIEAAFRVLKTDLSLRPIFHKKDQAVEAHLFLGILAYTLVNTIRFRLKASNIHHDWQNIVRMMNTQKAGTVSMNNRKGQRINIRLCSQPTVGANQIIKAMNYKLMPFHRKKFVFPES